MISCDTNLLFYALNARAPEQPQARAFFEAHADSPSFVLCELVLIELYGLLRNPVTRRPPLPAAEAVHIIDRFRRHPTWRVVDYPGPPARNVERTCGLWTRGALGGSARQWHTERRDMKADGRWHGAAD